MNKKFIIWTSVAAAAVIIAGGTAFALTGASHFPEPTTAAASTPKATAFAVVTEPSRDVLDDETALDLRREMPADGAFAYKLGDHWVAINRLQPLPTAVQADVDAEAAAAPRTTGTSFDAATAGVKNAEATAGQLQFATGKRVIFISRQLKGDGPTNVPAWSALGAITADIGAANEAGGWSDSASAKAAVTASVSAQPDASSYLIVVQE